MFPVVSNPRYHAQGVQPEADPSIFGHFAAKWFSAMIGVLISNTQTPQEAGVHYMLLDACVTFLGWDSLFPVPPRQEVAIQLMDYLVWIMPNGCLPLLRIQPL